MMCLTLSASTAYWITDSALRSECATTLATLRCTNTSPGSRPTSSLAGTRLSAQPIHRYCGVCCVSRLVKKPGLRCSMPSAQRDVLREQAGKVGVVGGVVGHGSLRVVGSWSTVYGARRFQRDDKSSAGTSRGFFAGQADVRGRRRACRPRTRARRRAARPSCRPRARRTRARRGTPASSGWRQGSLSRCGQKVPGSQPRPARTPPPGTLSVT